MPFRSAGSRPASRIVACALCIAVLAAACGSASARPDDASVEPAAATTGTVSVQSAEVFDATVVHDLAVSFTQDDYAALIESYASSGSKEWIEAIVTIDGTTYERAGIRLKGNSSLGGLRSDGRGGPGGDVDAAMPERLPWLIKLDKYVDGQSHDGITDLVVRSNNSETALNEAVALDLLELAGLASQDAAYAAFTVNGSDAVLRLVVEHPDDVWMADTLSATGALYKAESTGDYSYRGADPAAYDEVFDQEAGEVNADLIPLIEFLDFVNNSDDETFYAELANRLDVDAFATYLAMQELIANFDDIDGPGNNSYLYYDTDSGTFTVVPWDHNLAFGGPGLGGGFTPGNGPGVQPPGDAPAGGRPPGPGGGRGGSNILVERFLADSDYEALYNEKLARLRASLYDGGTASQVLAGWVALLETEAADLVETAVVSQEAAAITTYFSE